MTSSPQQLVACESGTSYFMSISVSIPSTRHVEAGGFTTYQLRVVWGTTNHVVSKRYSEFFDLHKKLRKVVRPYPEFPSKRLVKKSDPRVVEYRQRGLEVYIQGLVQLSPVHQLVLEFLQLGHSAIGKGLDEADCKEMPPTRQSPVRCTHFPVLRMTSQLQECPRYAVKLAETEAAEVASSGVSSSHSSDMIDMADIVTKGVISGLLNGNT